VFCAARLRFAQLLTKFGLALALGVVLTAPQARSALPADPNTVVLDELPSEARQTKELILSGGPFPHTKDGTVFGNRERLLPREKRGYYREYTVKTPGAKNRGARRIVCGGKPAAPEACYYTADHYASFRRIVQ
jgi:ribonuclease T1